MAFPKPPFLKQRKLFASDKADSDIEILHVKPGANKRSVQILKVERPKRKTPDVEIVKVIPGTSSGSDGESASIKKKVKKDKVPVDGFIGKVQKSK